MESAPQDHVSSSNMHATSPTQMEFVTSVPTMDVSGGYCNNTIYIVVYHYPT